MVNDAIPTEKELQIVWEVLNAILLIKEDEIADPYITIRCGIRIVDIEEARTIVHREIKARGRAGETMVREKKHPQ